MTHRDERQWLAYILDELTDQERELAEAHLYHCDICLARWEQALSSLEGTAALPSLGLSRADRMTDSIMEAVAQAPMYRKRDAAARPIGLKAAYGQAHKRKNEGGPGEANRRTKGERGERRRAFVHYAIAVCVTLMLMSTGLWKAIDAGAPSSVARQEHQSNGTAQRQAAATSYTERMMNHTVGLLEHWTEKAAGGGTGSMNERGMGS